MLDDEETEKGRTFNEIIDIESFQLRICWRFTMKKCVIFLFAIFSFLNAWNYDYRDSYEIALSTELETGSPATRNDGVVFDSLRTLPPRMRGFGDKEYFETFIKPQTRDSLNVRCVGRWPFGPGFEVYGDTSNNILCFGSGSGILVFDISTPSNPARLSQIAVNGLIMQVYIKDTLLFVSSYGNGIEVFNLANPSSPVKISQIDVPARDFCLKDTFAYCVAEDSLRIINIADILNPYQVGACWDSSYTISISGNYVYTGGRWKLSAIDVSDPTNPQEVNSLGVWVYTLTVDGDHCYCVLNTNGFTIYNISDPLNIWQESQMSTVGGVDIYKLGFYVYLPGFVIVDVGDSANPFVVGDTALPVYAQAVWVNNNFGYGFVANDYEGLTVININDPTNPVVDSQYYGADDSRDVFVQGDYAYVSNLRKGLKILDITTPANPFEVGEYDTTGTDPILETVWVRDSIAYVPVYSSIPPICRFKTINISNPTSPQLIGQCAGLTSGNDIFVKDTLAHYIETGAYHRVTITNPAAPETLQRYFLPYTTSWSIFVQDTFAFIANADSGLRILNVSNPAAPFEVGHFDNPPGGGATGIFVKDTLAYFATWGGGLRILNVTDPSSPSEIGFHPAAAWDVVVQDSIAFTTSSTDMKVINISDPTNPIEVGHYVTAYHPFRLFVQDSLIYAACFEAGMYIFERVPTGIVEKAQIDIVTSALSFKVSPNPVTQNLILLIFFPYKDEYQIDIYDIQGRKMSCLEKGEGKGTITKKYSLHNIPNGIYFIILSTEGIELVKKFVVIH
jgi:hypothetical protein